MSRNPTKFMKIAGGDRFSRSNGNCGEVLPPAAQELATDSVERL